MALDANGDAMTLVLQNGLGSALKPAGRPWLAPELILPELDTSVVPFQTLDVVYPDLVVNARGDAVAAWDTYRGRRATSDIVQVAYRPAGGTWGTPTTLSAEGGAPQAAINAQGDAIVVWTQSQGQGLGSVQSAFRPAGGNWQAPSIVSPNPEDVGGQQVALDGRGDAVVVWEQLSNVEVGPVYRAKHSLQSAARLAGGSWQADKISEPNPGVAAPQLAMNARGEAVVVWNSGNLTESIVRGAFGRAGKHWQRPRDLSGTNLSPTAPRVALDGRGDADAAWVRKSAGRYDNTVQASTRLAGRGWLAPHALSKSGQVAGEPDVGMDERGQVFAVWRLERGTQSLIQAADVPLPLRRGKQGVASSGR